jgi:hypothetical protein
LKKTEAIILQLIVDRKFGHAFELFKKIKGKLNKDNSGEFDKIFRFYFDVKKRGYLAKILDLKKIPPPPIDTSYSLGKRAFYYAILLNRRGAYSTCLRLLKNVRVHTMTEMRFLGGVNYFNGNYRQAIKCYQKSISIGKNIDLKTQELLIGNQLMCYLNLNSASAYNKLLGQARLLYENKNNQSLLAYELLGYLLRGNTVKAQTYWNKLEKFEFENRYSATFWYGVFAARNHDKNQYQSLKKIFTDYISSLDHDSSYFTFDSHIQYLAEGYKNNLELSKIEKNLLFYYPGVPHNEIQKIRKNAKSIFLNIKDNARITISYLTNEYNIDGLWYYKINKELDVLTKLRFAENMGITQERLISVVWENEPYSILALKDRLKKIIQRLRRKYAIEISVNNGVLKLENLKDVNILTKKSKPIYFEYFDELDIKKIMSFYNCSLSKAKLIAGKYH